SRYDRGQEYQIDESDLHHSEIERRRDEDKVDEGEGTNKGEQQAKSDAEPGDQARIAETPRPGDRAARQGITMRSRARRYLNGEPNQYCASQIEAGEDKEIGRETEMVSDSGGDHAAYEIARDVAGHVGGKRDRRLARTSVFPEIC